MAETKAPLVRTYHVTQKVGFFPEANVLVLTIASVWLATQLHMSGRAQSKPGDYLTIEAVHLENEVRFPIFGPVAAAVANKLPDDIQIGLVDENRRTPNPTKPEPDGTWGLKAFADSVFQPFIVNYYERHLPELRMKCGGAGQWPSAWQMGRVVRNAISHNGHVHFLNMNHSAVTWRGLSISPAQQGRRLLELVNGADLFVLAADMEEERAPGILKLT